MQRALMDWTVQEYKKKRLLGTTHYLVNMPNPFVKQTLYVMLDTYKRPTMWEKIANGKFFIING
jgi:hypothetical protein